MKESLSSSSLEFGKDPNLATLLPEEKVGGRLSTAISMKTQLVRVAVEAPSFRLSRTVFGPMIPSSCRASVRGTSVRVPWGKRKSDAGL